MNTTTDAAEWFGHPKGLYVCFFTEMWERFSFYGMRALLLLYVIKHHGFSDDTGYNLTGAYGGLVYAAPVLGGIVADRWLGMRKSVVFGGALLCLGHFGMAYEGQQAQLVNGVWVRDAFALQVFYLSLSLIVLGVGFLKPNISTVVGKLYGENDPRRDSGFSIYYAGINIGATLSALTAAWLGETYGWGYGFGIAGVCMLIGLATFLYGQRYLMGLAEPPDAAALAQRCWGPLTREHLIYLGALPALLLVWLLMQNHSRMLSVAGLPAMSVVLWSLHAISVVVLAWIVWFVARRCTRVQREQMLVLLVLIAACLVFFSLYEQTYGSWQLFSDRVMNRRSELGGWGFTWTAGQLTFLGPMFIILLAPLLSWLWPWLERRGRNPSKPLKSALGLIISGLSFLVLVWSARHPQANGLTGLAWFVLAYLVLEVGEMLLSPIGLAAVTQLSVPRVVGVMMGAWWLATAYSEMFAALLSKLSAIQIPESGVIDVGAALASYDALFVYSAQIGIGSGLLLLVCTPWLNRWLHGVK